MSHNVSGRLWSEQLRRDVQRGRYASEFKLRQCTVRAVEATVAEALEQPLDVKAIGCSIAQVVAWGSPPRPPVRPSRWRPATSDAQRMLREVARALNHTNAANVLNKIYASPVSFMLLTVSTVNCVVVNI